MRKCGELLLKRALKVVSGVTSRPCSVVVLVHLALECFWHLQSGLFRTLGPARGAHPLEAHLNPLAAHQRAPEVAPIIPDPNLSPDLDLGQDLNPGKSGFWFKVHNKIIVWDFGFLTCDFVCRSRSHRSSRRHHSRSRSRSRRRRSRSRSRSSEYRRRRSHSRSPMSNRRRHIGNRVWRYFVNLYSRCLWRRESSIFRLNSLMLTVWCIV